MSKKIKIITFSGVDGAGKTTVLREFTEILQSQYKIKVKELRHRPSILPILSSIKHGRKEAEKRTTLKLPRSGTNRSLSSSYLRFGYYFLDYLVGQWVVYFRYTLKGYLVIYDRYYFDFICDQKRSNLSVNRKLAKWLYAFVKKPDLNIFLYADADEILKRKNELPKEDIMQLTDSYKALFYDLGKRGSKAYACIENVGLKTTLQNIENLYSGN